MTIRERLQQRVTMTVLQRQCMIVITLLSTLLLLTVWPRFHNDAMSVAWYVYLILIGLFTMPLFKRS